MLQKCQSKPLNGKNRFLWFREWWFALKKIIFCFRAWGHYHLPKTFLNRYFPRTVRNLNYLTWKMQAPSGKKGPKTLWKGSGTLFTGFLDPFGSFFCSRSYKQIFEHFLIDILCCLNILKKYQKLKKKPYCHFKRCSKGTYKGLSWKIQVPSLHFCVRNRQRDLISKYKMSPWASRLRQIFFKHIYYCVMCKCEIFYLNQTRNELIL